jgi:hypothetical protein
LVIKPLEEDLTPGTVNPLRVSRVEPAAYQFQLTSKGDRAIWSLISLWTLSGYDRNGRSLAPGTRQAAESPAGTIGAPLALTRVPMAGFDVASEAILPGD